MLKKLWPREAGPKKVWPIALQDMIDRRKAAEAEAKKRALEAATTTLPPFIG
jgi:hypothetical protein